jgi:hypothetical protein
MKLILSFICVLSGAQAYAQNTFGIVPKGTVEDIQADSRRLERTQEANALPNCLSIIGSGRQVGSEAQMAKTPEGRDFQRKMCHIRFQTFVNLKYSGYGCSGSSRFVRRIHPTLGVPYFHDNCPPGQENVTPEERVSKLCEPYTEGLESAAGKSDMLRECHFVLDPKPEEISPNPNSNRNTGPVEAGR